MIDTRISRRTMLNGLVLSVGACAFGMRAESEINQPLAPWSKGELILHHLDTGRGNCMFAVGPDGTTLMVDAGSSNAPANTSAPARPNASKRPGEWIARYALRNSPGKNLDYFLATHIHPDHVGDDDPTSPQAAGGYKLTGVSDVDAQMPIATCIDRAFPDFGATPPLQAAYADNYLAFLRDRVRNKKNVEAAEIGSTRQITLKHNVDSGFKVRILSANGKTWNEKHPIVPQKPLNENALSIALRLDYGRFSYYTGGDLAADTYDGAQPWLDRETPTAHAAGRVEVATANHHGYFDAVEAEFTRSLDAQAYIIQSWDVGHPGSHQMQRMMGAGENKAVRDVFATEILPENALINRRFTSMLRGRQGHIVVRVAPGGGSYRIFVVDSTVENGNITAAYGPYQSRA